MGSGHFRIVLQSGHTVRFGSYGLSRDICNESVDCSFGYNWPLFSREGGPEMTFHSVLMYLQNAWQELAVGGVIGYAVAALKPLSTIIKTVTDYRKGKGRIRAEGELVPGLDDRQKTARHNNRDGFNAGELLEFFKIKVRNVGAVPAYVEKASVQDRDGDIYEAYIFSKWSQFLVPVGDEGPVEIAASSYHEFLVRIPFDKDVTGLKYWCVSFNNGVIFRVHFRSARQRLWGFLTFAQ